MKRNSAWHGLTSYKFCMKFKNGLKDWDKLVVNHVFFIGALLGTEMTFVRFRCIFLSKIFWSRCSVLSFCNLINESSIVAVSK